MNEFKLLQRSKLLLKYLESNILINIPKVYNSYRVGIETNVINLNENIIRANINNGSIRNKYQKEILVNISMIDLYLDILLGVNVINKKKFMSIVRLLSEIRKMCIGWMENEKVK